MEITAVVENPQVIKEMSVREIKRWSRAVTEGVTQTAVAARRGWRDQITQVLGGRLAKTIFFEVYPKGRPSPNAAALVYSKAPDVVSSHENGTLIRSSSGFFLAIPLEAAGRGPRGKRITPAEWEQKTGRQLTFIYRRGRSGLLIDEGKKAPGNAMARRRARRGGYQLSEPTTFKNRVVPIFALVPQVRMPKRLNLKAQALVEGGKMSSRIVAVAQSLAGRK